MPSPFSIRMATPDPLMDQELSNLLCNTICTCPGHLRAYSSQGYFTISDIMNTTMNTLHQLSLKHDHIDNFFGDRHSLNTGTFFNELLLLIQWATYHRLPFSDFTLATLDNIEEDNHAIELHRHFQHKLGYQNGPPNATTPTIFDLHPSIIPSYTCSSKPNTTPTISTSLKYCTVNPAIEPFSPISKPDHPTPTPVIHTTSAPSDTTSDGNTTAASFDHGFDEGYEAACDDFNGPPPNSEDIRAITSSFDDTADNHYNDDYEYATDNCDYAEDHYDDHYEYTTDNCDYDDDVYDEIDPEPPPW